jgi:hypothetical protein
MRGRPESTQGPRPRMEEMPIGTGPRVPARVSLAPESPALRSPVLS